MISVRFYIVIAVVLLVLALVATLYVWAKIQSLETLEPTEVSRPGVTQSAPPIQTEGE